MANPNGNVANLRPSAPFKPGQSGNPGGKPVGARNKLQGAFLNDLAAHFEEHGKRAIERACEENPLGYIRAVAALMPKQIEGADPFDGLDDDDVRALFAVVKLARLARKSDEEGVS